MPLVDFDFMPFGANADAYATYAAMRDAGRVLKSPMGALIVHRYDDVRAAHGDHERFSMGAIGEVGRGEANTGGFVAQTMLTTDPPDHERLRRVVQVAFAPKSIAAMEDRIRDVTRRLLADRRGAAFDIVADFAGPLPTIVIAELLGVPPEDAAQFRLWSDSITGGDAMTQMAGGGDGAEAMRRYLLGQIAKRETEPTDDLIGRMVIANHDGSMSNEEVAAACVLLLIAGNETTMRLITNMTLALGRFRDQQELVAKDRSLVMAAVEETLRYDSPVQMLFRATKSPVQIDDVDLRVGSFVLTMLGAANRDPAAFPNPDVFDIERTGNPHIAFGHGIHFCLGAQLARMEARVAFEELFDLLPSFELVTQDHELDYPMIAMLRSPKSLVIRTAS